MPISTLDPAALARLTPGEIASLALSADQSARHARAMGRLDDALAHDEESSRLAQLFRRK